MRRIVLRIMAAAWFLVAGCAGLAPPETPAEPLETLQASGQAIARVYSTPIPVIAALATHTWFVVKRADSTEFHRWEIFVFSGGIYEYIHRDLFGLEEDLGAGGATVVAELIGPEAERVIDFIESGSADYPCRDFYRFAAGPNSNGYTQWVLDSTGWAVQLPATALGKDVHCPL